jgi:hypothetical protein
MFDIENEQPISLNDARRLPCLKGRQGNSISLCTITRWAKQGILVGSNRVVLETAKIGGAIRTSEASIIRFVERLNQSDNAPTCSSSSRRQQIARAEKRLDEAGI